MGRAPLKSLSQTRWDVVIVGAGAVGCATARELAGGDTRRCCWIVGILAQAHRRGPAGCFIQGWGIWRCAIRFGCQGRTPQTNQRPSQHWPTFTPPYWPNLAPPLTARRANSDDTLPFSKSHCSNILFKAIPTYWSHSSLCE